MLSERQILSLKLARPGTCLLAFVCCPAPCTPGYRVLSKGFFKKTFSISFFLSSLRAPPPPLPQLPPSLITQPWASARRGKQYGSLVVLGVKRLCSGLQLPRGFTVTMARGCELSRWSLGGVSSLLCPERFRTQVPGCWAKLVPLIKISIPTTSGKKTQTSWFPVFHSEHVISA